jgi:hypothetical protein
MNMAAETFRYYQRYRRPANPPDARAALERERRALLHQASDIDRQQRVLAEAMGDIRSKLASNRVIMWPRVEPRDIVHDFRRKMRGGPPPIPPPARNAHWVRGRALRFAALAMLARSNNRPMSPPEIHRELHLAGYGIASRTPVKRLADALGYETSQGRAIRTDRGWYRLGQLSSADRRRAEQHGDSPQPDRRGTRIPRRLQLPRP